MPDHDAMTVDDCSAMNDIKMIVDVIQVHRRPDNIRHRQNYCNNKW